MEALSFFAGKTAKPTDIRPSALLLKKDIKKNIEDVVIRDVRNNGGIICHNRCYYSISISYVLVSSNTLTPFSYECIGFTAFI